MTKTFTLEGLKKLLKEKEEKEAQRKASQEIASIPNPAATKEAIHEFYRKHGILAPIEGLFVRKIPDTVYTCPLSEPMTTLVSWDSLPRTIQGLYDKPTEPHGILEVNRNHLLSEQVAREENTTSAENQYQQQSLTKGLQKRPLQGNMTNKLTEYTRGVTGQAKPFLPGGATTAQDVAQVQDNPYMTPEAIERSMDAVLRRDSKTAWKDGTLITAPPGVSFKVGLSYQDVYGKEDEDDDAGNDAADCSGDDHAKEVEHVVTDDDVESPVVATAALNLTKTIQWDQNFLDDDSLFGSSVDSSSSSGNDSSEGSGDGDNSDHQDEEEGVATESPAKPVTAATGHDTITGSDQEIDQLLVEITYAEARTKREMIREKEKDAGDDHDDDGGTINPLRLAEKQAMLQNNTTKKSWASTKLLPIDDFHSYIPNPAMEFSFTLDPFQQQAVARLERSESVFVAAHTSAGKTVVAEYAVALAQQRGTRCIYTSPIKALSNQKFRDFSLKFGSQNVGLITGDLQVNADDSTCIIMTTEILRSMLYRGADLIRDIEFVVFDEVHYVNDSERGVVWEEVIIMLPAYVNLIFLSATTPNTFEFSDWIGRTKKKPVYVVKTDYRPVPLSHYLWANLKLHKVKEGNGGFLDKGYQDASSALKPKSDKKNAGGKGKPVPSSGGRGPQNMMWQAQGGKSQWMSLVRFLEREELTPTVVFSFSKKKCEEIANMLQSLDLNTAVERSAVQGFTLQTVARLSPVDASLPQVRTVCEMVARGIGVHHGGLLPILKEMVEILFSRNLIKVLFATETFAMGVNMPARSVVFNSIRKHDGTQFRVLEPGEYTQMAGRAGRRGLDKVGTVIMCCFGEQPPPIAMLRKMLTGTSTLLRSQFRLTYNMILNLLRVEEMSVEGMIKRSFSEFATQRALTANEYPKLLARGQKTLSKLQERFDAEARHRLGAEDIEEYFSSSKQLTRLNTELLMYTLSSADTADSILQPGRVLLVTAARKHGVVRAPAMILGTETSAVKTTGVGEASKLLDSLICLVLLPASYTADKDKVDEQNAKTCAIGEVGFAKQRHYGVYKIQLDAILLVSATKVKIDPNELYASKSGGQGAGAGLSSFFDEKPAASRKVDDPFAGMMARSKKNHNNDDVLFGKKKSTGQSSSESAIDGAISTLIEAEKEEITIGLPPLAFNDFLKRGNDVVELRRHAATMDTLAAEMRSCKSHSHPTIEKYYVSLEHISTLQERVQALNHLLSNESLQLFPDFLQRKAVLKTLGYLDENEAVAVKGRVACEVNTCEELIVTEMVFEGVLNDLDPPEIVAALSSLIYQQKSENDEFDMEIPESLLNCCKQMKTIAMNLGKIQKAHGLDVDPIEYTEGSLKFGLVHVVYEWAIGISFEQITQLTTAQEGSIVRCITRLDELCREVRNCARVVGNPTLYRKMEAASSAIKRDIVFAASLYVS
jgi:antiviral helicase SKI2